MRSFGYVTMLDPLQKKYGEVMCGLLFIPALLGEIFWSAATLSALGATIAVVIGLDNTTSVITSTCIALIYTIFGGLYSVAYTDVVQLFCIFVGLWLSVPFAMTNPAVHSIHINSSRWIGSMRVSDSAVYLDNMLMLTLGGVPWQVYFQAVKFERTPKQSDVRAKGPLSQQGSKRVLSARTARGAQVISFLASFGCLVMAIPAMLMGAIAASTDWTKTAYNRTTVDNMLAPAEMKLVLPLVLQYLCPPAVSFIGLGAISAAVMSSADSSVFSAASMFAHNVVQPTCWRRASERQIIWVMRLSIFVVGALACAMGILVKSIYGLWSLCSDLVYVILFPQLVSVLFLPFSNTYGSLVGFGVGLVLRLTAGEPIFHMPALIKYPYYDALTDTQRAPIKTISMLGSFAASTLVSLGMYLVWRAGYLSGRRDIFRCFTPPVENKVGGSTDDYPPKPILQNGEEAVGLKMVTYGEEIELVLESKADLVESRESKKAIQV
ncbi:unnamed protein product [Schistocephalus solidus]|uniref:High-affinity choline transporter 1 n=1 Tax=Schistocephalus solidus TaxID=70667 RepID=A0A183T0P7_SCHSO|nr:unnamed protein product [Schistocephalus solidus]